MRELFVGAALLAMVSSSVDAATLVNLTGDVLVNGGRGFARAVEGQNLRPGDRVMVGRGGGSATIAYDPLCIERVEVGRVATVAGGVPCNVTGTATSPAAFGAGVPSTALIIGGGAAVVGAGVLIYSATKKSSSP